jgi:hypothetical protein
VSIDIYDRGWVDGVRAFAWWKDGTQYVGTTGTTLTDAITRRNKLSGYDPVPDAAPINAELLTACKAQHDAIDILFALLIDKTNAEFLPSKSGKPWEAILLGNAAIANAEGRA